MALSLASKLKFVNGYEIPVIGLGTWKSKSNEVREAVRTAIEAGYRHIDTAFAYGNEAEVGDGVKTCIEAGIVKREELFITTKLWNTFHRPDLVEGHARQSLKNLQLDYVDLYMMHWPLALQEGEALFPKNAEGEFLHSDIDYVDTWKAMQKLVDAGLVRSLGICNANSLQIKNILESGGQHPLVNLQVEISPYFPNTKLLEFALSRGITVTGYSPFGSPDRPWVKPEDRVLFNEDIVKNIATRRNKTPGQVILRWGLQRGYAILPKSITASRIRENLQIFDFELTKEDMNEMNSFDPCRSLLVPWYSGSKNYPFREEF